MKEKGVELAGGNYHNKQKRGRESETGKEGGREGDKNLWKKQELNTKKCIFVFSLAWSALNLLYQ